MKCNRFYTILILSIFSVYALGQEVDRVKIKNYSIGDKIDRSDFVFKNRTDSAVHVCNCISVKELTVFTWFDTVVWIGYTYKSKVEFEQDFNSISKLLNNQPKVNQDTISKKVDVKGISYFWYDTKTADEISMGYNIDSIGNFSGALLIENIKFSNELIPKEESIDLEPVFENEE